MPNAAPVLALLGIGTAIALAASSSHAAAPAKGASSSPAPQGATVHLDTALPPQLEDQVLHALSTSQDPAELSALATQLDAQGYPLAAAALRARAAQLQATASLPGAATPPASTPSTITPPTALPALDPNIGSLGPAVLTALSTETDPAKLIGFAHSIQDQYPMAAAALMTKAAALQAAARTAQAAQAAAQGVTPATSTSATPAAAMPPGTPPTTQPDVAVVATPPAATPVAATTSIPTGPGAWVAATDADVARDGVASRYAALLTQAVGTTITEAHNGRTWEFKVVSAQTDPTLTTYAKDVKGWIWQPTATAPAPAPVLVPVVTSQTMSTVPPSATVRQLQHNLNLLGQQPPLVEDGINGPKTIAAVKAFQTAHGLIVDGIAGPKTKGAIAAALGTFAPAPAATAPTATALPAASSSAVRQLQHNLNLLGQQPPLVEDGIRGPKTIAAIKAFQSAYGLTVDGVAGPLTNAAMTAALAAAAANPQGGPSASPAPSTSLGPPLALPPVVTVQDVQSALNALGIVAPALKVDGIAGPLTTNAIKLFQMQQGLTIDGSAGPQTRAALAAALAKKAGSIATQGTSFAAGRRMHLHRSAP